MSEVFEYWSFFPLTDFFSFSFLNRGKPFIVSNQNKRLTFSVTLKNEKESAYNTGLVVDFSENLFFASWSMPVCDDTLGLPLLCFLLVVNYPLPYVQTSLSSVLSEKAL